MKKDGIDPQRMFKAVPGSGEQICFWTDWWILDEPLFKKFPSLFELEGNKQSVIADRCGFVNGIFWTFFEWARQPDSPTEKAELRLLSETVSRLYTLVGHEAWVWNPGSSSLFSVSDIRKQLQGVHFAETGTGFKWNNWAPLKVSFFAWRVALNRLPMMDNLERGIHVRPDLCKLCKECPETAGAFVRIMRSVSRSMELCRVVVPNQRLVSVWSGGHN
ncbi:putative reverse transcriptase zinc-binding domain-containing protein [Helianthus annuus]|nr:putative reverse transcriptase zinc-binding domain-containing protein [Helianthus annuus]